MDREVDLFEREPVLDGERRLGDQVGRARADDVRAQQLARVGVRQDLDEAFRLPECQRATGGREREPAHLDGDALLLRLLLAEPDVRDLGLGVDTVRGSTVIGHAPGVSGDVLDAADALVRRDVGEHAAADHVADRPDSLGVGTEVLVDPDPLADELAPRVSPAEPVAITMSLAWVLSPPTSTTPLPASRAAPVRLATPPALSRPSTPFTSWSTTMALRFWAVGQSKPIFSATKPKGCPALAMV